MYRDNQRQRKLNEAVGGRSNWKNAGGRRAYTCKLQRLKITETQMLRVMANDSLGLQHLKISHNATVCASSWGYVIHSLRECITTGFHNLLKKRPPSLIMLLR